MNKGFKQVQKYLQQVFIEWLFTDTNIYKDNMYTMDSNERFGGVCNGMQNGGGIAKWESKWISTIVWIASKQCNAMQVSSIDRLFLKIGDRLVVKVVIQ